MYIEYYFVNIKEIDARERTDHHHSRSDDDDDNDALQKNVEEETTSKTKRSSDLISYLVRSNSIRVARKTPARHRSLRSL